MIILGRIFQRSLQTVKGFQPLIEEDPDPIFTFYSADQKPKMMPVHADPNQVQIHNTVGMIGSGRYLSVVPTIKS